MTKKEERVGCRCLVCPCPNTMAAVAEACYLCSTGSHRPSQAQQDANRVTLEKWAGALGATKKPWGNGKGPDVPDRARSVR